MNYRFAKDITFFFLEHGVKTLSALASTLIIINYLAPSSYGILALALTTFSVIASVSSLGLDSILLKRLIEVKSLKPMIDSLILRLYAAFILSLSTITLALLVDKHWLVLLCLLLITLYFDSLLALREYAFSEKKYTTIILANVFSSISQLLLVLVIVYNELELYWFVVPYIFNRIIFISILLSKFENKHELFKKISIKPNLNLLQEGLPLMLAAMAGLVYAAQDQWMIAYFMSEKDVGIYAIAIKLVLTLLVVPTIITNILYHKIINLRDSSEYLSYIKSLYSACFYVGAGIYFVILLITDWVVGTAFPLEYSSASEVIEIYSLVLLIAFFQSLNNKLLILEGLQTFIFQRVILSVIINFALNLIMIPRYGLIGAAYATVCSETFVIFSYSFNKKTRKLIYYQISALNPTNLISSGNKSRD